MAVMPKQTPPQRQQLHLLRPGTFTAMDGRSYRFSEADLRQIAGAYDPRVHEAPITIGHPSHDAPAYGWAESLRFHEGDDEAPIGLYALASQVNPDFADMVAAGAFKKISPAFYGPTDPANPKPGGYYPRHIGFLGAQPPAIKGLRNPAFSDDGSAAICFSEEFAAPSPSPQESTVTEEEVARLRAENEQLTARNAQLQADAAALAAAGRHADNLAFAEKLVSDGRLISAAVPTIVATLDHLAGAAAPIEFGEGSAKAPLLQALKDQLQANPLLVASGETATTQRAAGSGKPARNGLADPLAANPAFSEADPTRLSQHEQILDYAAEHKLGYEAAAFALIK